MKFHEDLRLRWVECLGKHEPTRSNQERVIYKATVLTRDGREESYVGLAKNFKKRFMKNRATLKNRNTLSNYVWEQMDKQMDPRKECSV